MEGERERVLLMLLLESVLLTSTGWKLSPFPVGLAKCDVRSLHVITLQAIHSEGLVEMFAELQTRLNLYAWRRKL